MNAERRGLSRFMRKTHKPRQKRPDSLAKSARRPVIAGVKRLGAAMNKGVNEVFRSMVSSLRVWKKWVRGFGIVPERLLSRGLQKAKVMPCWSCTKFSRHQHPVWYNFCTARGHALMRKWSSPAPVRLPADIVRLFWFLAGLFDLWFAVIVLKMRVKEIDECLKKSHFNNGVEWNVETVRKSCEKPQLLRTVSIPSFRRWLHSASTHPWRSAPRNRSN